jgi:hypothetical protein
MPIGDRRKPGPIATGARLRSFTTAGTSPGRPARPPPSDGRAGLLRVRLARRGRGTRTPRRRWRARDRASSAASQRPAPCPREHRFVSDAGLARRRVPDQQHESPWSQTPLQLFTDVPANEGGQIRWHTRTIGRTVYTELYRIYCSHHGQPLSAVQVRQTRPLDRRGDAELWRWTPSSENTPAATAALAVTRVAHTPVAERDDAGGRGRLYRALPRGLAAA